MSKNLLYRLFGLRKVPKEIRERLQHESIVFDEEGISCALSYKNFRSKYKRSGRGWQSSLAGTLVVTNKTLYIALPYKLVVDRPIESAINHLELEAPETGQLKMKFDVESLFDGASGELVCYWRTIHADVILRHLESIQSS